MPFDIHVHFFTRSLLSARAGRWLNLIRSAGSAETLLHHEPKNRTADPAAFVGALDSGLRNKPVEIMEHMDRIYGGDWNYVPMMVDLEYALADGTDIRFPGLDADWMNMMYGPDPEAGDGSTALAGLRTRVERAWKALAGGRIEAGAPRILARRSFEIQLSDMEGLKAVVPDRIHPFLAIDPRRERIAGINLVELAGDLVGPGKTFSGIKLYPSCGFSPTDPLLFDTGGLYSHCARHRIPVTVHFAPTGFATPHSSVLVFGDVFHPLSGGVVPAEEVFPGGRIDFSTRMGPGTIAPAVEERQVVLNHPLLWEKVLDRWPGLVVNFGHAGGDTQAGRWLAHPGDGDWMSRALGFALKRRNAYVDFSAHTGDLYDMNVLAATLRRRHPGLRRKVLFGSDYFLSVLKEPDLGEMQSRQREAFGPWWTNMTGRNPRRFLKGGTGSRND